MSAKRHSRAGGLILVVGLLAVGLLAVGLLAASDSSASDEEKAKAEKLVDSLQDAGIAPRLTVETAEALYGTDASAVCDAFSGGPSTSGAFILLGNPSGRRPKTITTDAVEYGRQVIKTYCPDELSDYDDVVDDLDPIESTR